jgi:hypothetical protein
MIDILFGKMMPNKEIFDDIPDERIRKPSCNITSFTLLEDFQIESILGINKELATK